MRGKITKIALLTVVVCLLVAGSVLAMSSTNYSLDWFTPGTSGGGGTSTSTNYAADFTVGQSAIGSGSSTNYTATLGYWAGLPSYFRVFLPLTIKN